MNDQTLHDQVIERAMKDQAFRQALLSNPRAALARTFNVQLAEQVTIRVIEEAPNTLTLVLPAALLAMQDLSDADLQAATGGMCGISYINGITYVNGRQRCIA